jgi:hypothetical protein
MERRSVVSDVSGQLYSAIFRGTAWTFLGGNDWLSRDVGGQLPVDARRRRSLICIAAETEIPNIEMCSHENDILRGVRFAWISGRVIWHDSYKEFPKAPSSENVGSGFLQKVGVCLNACREVWRVVSCVYLRSAGRSLTEQRNVCQASRDFQVADANQT